MRPSARGSVRSRAIVKATRDLAIVSSAPGRGEGAGKQSHLLEMLGKEMLAAVLGEVGDRRKVGL